MFVYILSEFLGIWLYLYQKIWMLKYSFISACLYTKDILLHKLLFTMLLFCSYLFGSLISFFTLSHSFLPLHSCSLYESAIIYSICILLMDIDIVLIIWLLQPWCNELPWKYVLLMHEYIYNINFARLKHFLLFLDIAKYLCNFIFPQLLNEVCS